MSVCLFVRALTGKRLELSTPTLVNVYSIAVARHALTQRSEGQKSRSHGHENRHGRRVARLLVTMSLIPHTHTPLFYLRPLPACVCMSIRLPMFCSWCCYDVFMCLWTAASSAEWSRSRQPFNLTCGQLLVIWSTVVGHCKALLFSRMRSELGEFSLCEISYVDEPSSGPLGVCQIWSESVKLSGYIMPKYVFPSFAPGFG